MNFKIFKNLLNYVKIARRGRIYEIGKAYSAEIFGNHSIKPRPKRPHVATVEALAQFGVYAVYGSEISLKTI